MRVNDDEYKEAFKNYLIIHGPNPNSGMIGRWAWIVQMENKFQEELCKQGLLTSKSQ